MAGQLGNIIIGLIAGKIDGSAEAQSLKRLSGGSRHGDEGADTEPWIGGKKRESVHAVKRESGGGAATSTSLRRVAVGSS